jgi:hypothetical protein
MRSNKSRENFQTASRDDALQMRPGSLEGALYRANGAERKVIAKYASPASLTSLLALLDPKDVCAFEILKRFMGGVDSICCENQYHLLAAFSVWRTAVSWSCDDLEVVVTVRLI